MLHRKSKYNITWIINMQILSVTLLKRIMEDGRTACTPLLMESTMSN